MRAAVAAWTRRSIGEPLWARVTGASMLDEWYALERTQYEPPETLRARQDHKLRALMTAAATIPFYGRRFAEAGVRPDQIRTVQDLQKLPVLRKRDVRRHAAEMLAPGARPEQMMQIKTGGSTGTALVFHATERVSHLRNAAARRANLWTGWKAGEPFGAIWGNPEYPRSVREHIRNGVLYPVIYLDTMSLSVNAVEEFARQWRRKQPTMIFGHAHSIYMLATTVRDHGITGIQPRTILSTSMMLLSHERQVIEHVFGTKVFDRYGCEEVGLIGCECEVHDGMHLNVDHLIVEFLSDDGKPVDPGQTGYVVVTDLINHEMPFIRYQVEDIARRLERPCPCGRTLPLMDRIAGRVADFLVRHDGVRVAGVSLIENTLTKIPGIAQMQIVQEARDLIELRIVSELNFGAAQRQELITYFEETFPRTAIELILVEEISREPNGKYRFSICKVHE